MNTVDRAASARTPLSPAGKVKKKILAGSAWVFLGKFLGTFLGVAVNAVLARVLSKQELGGYFLAFSIVMIGSTVSQLGLNKTVVRLVAAGLATGQPGRARDAIRISFTLSTICSLLLGSVLALGPGQQLAESLFDSDKLAKAMPFVAGWLVCMTLQTMVGETFRGFKRFWAATLMGGLLVDLFSLAVFGLLWLQGTHPSLSNVIMIVLGMTALSALCGGVAILAKYPRLKGRGTADRREVLAISLPLLVVSLSSFFVGTGVDLWVISSVEPTSQAALYGAASRLVFFVATPFIIVSQVVPPIIAQLYEQGRKHDLENALRSVATLAAGPAGIVMLLFVAFGGTVMAVVFGNGYRQAGTVLAILSVARLYAVYTGSCGVALTMTGHQRVMMWITMLTAGISLAAELILVHPWGIVGVAIATCGAQIMQNTMQLIATRREIGIWTHAELSLKPFAELFRMRGRS
jgi:O-antigen/teichoic acid export membrane protein